MLMRKLGETAWQAPDGECIQLMNGRLSRSWSNLLIVLRGSKWWANGSSH